MDDREKVAQELCTLPEYLEHYSFPQAFGSTCGPFPGAGGQMVTSFQIDAYTDGVDTVFYSCGRRIKQVKDWKFNIRMPR